MIVILTRSKKSSPSSKLVLINDSSIFGAAEWQKTQTLMFENGRKMREIVQKALSSLGRGFDITNDFQLKFVEGKERLVSLDESKTRDISVPGFGVFNGVPVDIRCDKGERIRFQSDVLEFNNMAEIFNQRSQLTGKIPSGLFNSMFGFNGCSSWAQDAKETKCLALDGYYISLFNLVIDRYPLSLYSHVIQAVPTTWNPVEIARFIEKYGTHIIVGMSMGGQDVVLVKQDHSSNLHSSDIKRHLDQLGDQLFTGTCSIVPSSHTKVKDYKQKAPEAFNIFDRESTTMMDILSPEKTKEGITVMCSKRGGDPMAETHHEWLLTVPSMLDAINFSFIPIISLLNGVPGNGYLSHAINLYLRYKPPIGELQYFLDFQCHKIWAPVHSDLPLGPPSNRAIPTPALQFNVMGSKLYVNTAQVISASRPVTGVRLYLEGMKCNRLAIHLQHASSLSPLLGQNITNTSVWRNSGEFSSDNRYFLPVKGKNCSHVCTAPVVHNSTQPDSCFIVTGAQLLVKTHDTRRVLHLNLLFTRMSKSIIRKSVWERGTSNLSTKSSFFSIISTSMNDNPKENKNVAVVIDSSVYPSGPPVPVQSVKMLKFVDTSELCKGPEESPGYWLVTGAKLNTEKKKIKIEVQFSLLSSSSS